MDMGASPSGISDFWAGNGAIDFGNGFEAVK
jgi:hypothetical protein